MTRCLMTAAVCIGISGFVPMSAAAADTANPPVSKVKEKVTEEAREQGIPPEILKAIAAQESDYRQFDHDGEPHMSPGGGIGIMQVNPAKLSMELDKDKLKQDIAYNIKMGARVLLNKWQLDSIPDVNQHDKAVLEDWYFAIMAYNGLSAANDPGLHGADTYQNQVYNRIEQASFLPGPNGSYFTFPSYDIQYQPNSQIMSLSSGNHYATQQQTVSQQLYDLNDFIFLNTPNSYTRFPSDSFINSADTPLTIVTQEPGILTEPSNMFLR
ncbi:hypothetical protein GCM10028778_12110 [Barrientosiimonas marina]|uniref:Transglycosylase SLT domain-containing protein n=1 Tax=Lentibacillus kimchii TaxID=1542911 RepID=A0ABW2UYI2_9BACI